jgi:putative nucleotidyltransferase with HDIG domain
MFPRDHARGKHLLLNVQEEYPFTLQQGSVVDLLGSMSSYNHDLRGHAERVCGLCMPMAFRMGLAGKRLLYLRLAALLHDVGKLDVPPHILEKPGMLSLQETLVVQDHSLRGEQMLRSLSLPDTICQTVRSHHERFDGRGYPDGLAGEEIPPEARIVQVADAYDAMTEDRPYRAAMTPEAARFWIAGLSGVYFDPEVVDCFLTG